jgi:hypothetical protein
MPLHEEHKLRISQVVRLGCDRATACAFAGTTLADLQRELDRDPAFRSELHRLEAEVEMRHMGNVLKAAQDEKNWRTSVWWLEQRAARRSNCGTGQEGLWDLVDELSLIISEEIADVAVQRRIVERLLKVAAGPEGGERGAVDPGPGKYAVRTTQAAHGAPDFDSSPDLG